MSFFRTMALSAIAGAAMISAAIASDWTRFRGSDGSGVSADTGIPTKFSEKENLKWRLKLPGDGTSSPVIVGDNVIVTCYSGYGTEDGRNGSPEDLKRHLVVVNRKTGKIRWQKDVAADPPERRASGRLLGHGFASSTPTTDGERIYVFFGRSGLFCYDMKGKKLWKKSLGTGSHRMGYGTAASPILYKDLVIVNAAMEDGAVVALNKKTGNQVWKQKLESLRNSWSTPLIVHCKEPKRDELVLTVEYEIWSLNPATGKLLWYCEGPAPSNIAPSLIEHDGVVYATGGIRPQAVAVKVGGKGDVNKTHVLWKNRKGNYVTSPVLYEGRLYVVSHSGGRLSCLNAKTGETIFESRINGARGVYASPTIADGKMYVPSRNNGVFVLAAENKYKLLAHNTFSDDRSTSNASPAVANNELFLRSNKYLYCISAAGSDTSTK